MFLKYFHCEGGKEFPSNCFNRVEFKSSQYLDNIFVWCKMNSIILPYHFMMVFGAAVRNMMNVLLPSVARLQVTN